MKELFKRVSEVDALGVVTNLFCYGAIFYFAFLYYSNLELFAGNYTIPISLSLFTVLTMLFTYSLFKRMSGKNTVTMELK